MPPRICEALDCLELATFGYEGDCEAFLCLEHKGKNMVPIIKKTCLEAFCCNDAIDIYCKLHRIQSIEIPQSEICVIDGCNNFALYNYPGERNMYCAGHKLPEMINLKLKLNECLRDGCKVFPSFNYRGESSRIYCSFHKLDGMVNIRMTLCNHRGCNRYAYYSLRHCADRYCALHKTKQMIRIRRIPR